jgi:ubiquinone/menaquinone biosynthesis C-methylase UbiE
LGRLFEAGGSHIAIPGAPKLAPRNDGKSKSVPPLPLHSGGSPWMLDRGAITPGLCMSEIRFDDGAAYERMMGVWSRLAGDVFLDWLKPAPGQTWLDVGCGNGAFSELIVTRTAPGAVHGIDPSDGQLAFARTRPHADKMQFRQGGAMELPYADNAFDAATMALVLFFVPDPARGVAEMARVVKPGGSVAAYAWDMLGGGFPFEPVFRELRALGHKPADPPSIEASRQDAMQALWRAAGLVDIETRVITVERTFDDFEDFWASILLAPGMKASSQKMTPEEAAALKERVRGRLPARPDGRIGYPAWANAVKGRVA